MSARIPVTTPQDESEQVATAPSPAIASDRRVWGLWLPLLAAAVCMGIALLSLGDRDLWYDEAFSVTSTSQLWSSLVQRSASMGLYYVMLTPWVDVSIDPFWLRLPSVLFAGAAVALSTRFALEFFGRRVAWWTALLLVPMFAVVRYGQEARSYALVMALAVASWHLFLRLAERSTPRAWIVWGVCAAALAYSHPIAGLIPATQLVAMRSRPARIVGLERRSLAGWITFGVLLLPMLATFGMRTGAQPGWVSPVGWSTVGEAMWMIAGPHGELRAIWLLTLVAASVHLVARRRNHDPVDHWRGHCLVMWLWITPVVLVLVSLAQPMLVARYIIGVVPAAALAAAVAVSEIRSRPVRVVVGGLLVVALVPGIWTLHHSDGHRWSDAVAHIESQLDPDERHGILFTSDEVRQPFEVNGHSSRVLEETVPVQPSERWGTNLRYHEEVSLDRLFDRTADLDVLWEVNQLFVDSETLGDDRYEALGFCLVEAVAFSPGIEVTRFAPCE